jgi:hypothetical protein
MGPTNNYPIVELQEWLFRRVDYHRDFVAKALTD